MTVNSEQRVIEILGDGEDSTFDFPFYFAKPEHIRVWRTAPAGDAQALVINADYILLGEGTGAGTVNLIEEGDIEAPLPLPAGYVLRIERVLPLLQERVFPTHGAFSPKTLERALDDTVMLTQQVRDESEEVVADLEDLEAELTLRLTQAETGLAAETSARAAADASLSARVGTIESAGPYLPLEGGTVTGPVTFGEFPSLEGIAAPASGLQLLASPYSNNVAEAFGFFSHTALTEPGARLAVFRNASATPVLSVHPNGTVESAGGFKFPDGTVQTSAAMEGGYLELGGGTLSGPLAVQGLVESTTGGFRFPDGTTQTTSTEGLATQVGIIDSDLDDVEARVTTLEEGAGAPSSMPRVESVDGLPAAPAERILTYVDSAARPYFHDGFEWQRVPAAMEVLSSDGGTVGNFLTVNGIVESTTGGFRFPDGTTQTTAATGGGGGGGEGGGVAEVTQAELDAEAAARAAGDAARLLLTGGTLSGALAVTDGASTMSVTSAGLTFPDGTTQTEGFSSDELVMRAGDTITGNLEVVGDVTAGGVLHSTTGGIRFPDNSLQMSAATAEHFLPLEGGTLTGALTVTGAPAVTLTGMSVGAPALSMPRGALLDLGNGASISSSTSDNTIVTSYGLNVGGSVISTLHTVSNTNSVTLRGRASDGASAVGVILDNTTTLNNATSKLLSVRNNTSEKLAVRRDGALVFADATVQTTAATTSAATTSTAGLMSAADKTRLDNLPTTHLASYAGTDAVGVGAALVRVNFPTAKANVGATVNNASTAWQYVAPSAGLYRIAINLELNMTAVARNLYILARIFTNATEGTFSTDHVLYGALLTSATTAVFPSGIFDSLLVSGQAVSVWISNNAGTVTPTATASRNFVTVQRIA